MSESHTSSTKSHLFHFTLVRAHQVQLKGQGEFNKNNKNNSNNFLKFNMISTSHF